MAKGFKVVTTPPEKGGKSADDGEFTIDKARELVKGKTFIFCLPGRTVSYIFLKNFVQLAFEIVQKGGTLQISQDYSSMVNFARCNFG